MSKRNHSDAGLGTLSSGVSGADPAPESERIGSTVQSNSSRLQDGRGKDLRLRYLHAMGIDVWVLRNLGAGDSGPETRRTTSFGKTPISDDTDTHSGSPDWNFEQEVPLVSSSQAPRSAQSDIACLDWPALESRVAGCTLCNLHRTRTQTVFGVGSQTADWLFIGEAPGRDEDAQGEPFVGRAGQLLNNMLRAIGFSREQVYIANILKCRPPKNRDPRPEEAQACEPYLQRQIAMLRPKVIVALGRIAAQNLLHTDMPIGKMRGKRYTYADTGIPVRVTYHPAYLLRSPGEKRKAWQDLLLAQKMVKGG